MDYFQDANNYYDVNLNNVFFRNNTENFFFFNFKLKRIAINVDLLKF